MKFLFQMYISDSLALILENQLANLIGINDYILID